MVAISREVCWSQSSPSSSRFKPSSQFTDKLVGGRDVLVRFSIRRYRVTKGKNLRISEERVSNYERIVLHSVRCAWLAASKSNSFGLDSDLTTRSFFIFLFLPSPSDLFLFLFVYRASRGRSTVSTIDEPGLAF